MAGNLEYREFLKSAGFTGEALEEAMKLNEEWLKEQGFTLEDLTITDPGWKEHWEDKKKNLQ